MTDDLKKFRESVNKTIIQVINRRKEQIKVNAIEQKQAQKEQRQLLIQIKIQQELIKKKKPFKKIFNRNTYFTPANELLDLTAPVIHPSKKIETAPLDKSMDLTNKWKYINPNLTLFSNFGKVRSKTELKYSEQKNPLSESQDLKKSTDSKNTNVWFPNSFKGTTFNKFIMDPKDKYVNTKTKFFAVTSDRMREKRLWRR